MKIFYSWQSDLPNNTNRNYIQGCIDRVVKEHKGVVDIKADRDTKGELGTPNIVTTIFRKIDECDLFVADVSVINKKKNIFWKKTTKLTPNPNVLIELGYAVAKLGWDRVICICNTDYGDVQALPFDLRQQRILTYSIAGKDKAVEKKKIVDAISSTIEALQKSGNMVRPKGTMSMHMLNGFDINEKKTVPELKLIPMDFSSLRKELIELGRNVIAKMERARIDFQAQEKECNVLGISRINLGLEQSKHIEISNEEKYEVSEAIKVLLEIEISDSLFYFGSLEEKYIPTLFGPNYEYIGSEEEKEKYESYTSLKRIVSEIAILDLFRGPFEDVFMLPLSITNVSDYLDTNININIIFEGEGFELIHPSTEMLSHKLKDNVGFVCDYDFISDVVANLNCDDITYDESYEIHNFKDYSPSINLWDVGTTYDEEDCVNLMRDYIADPISNNRVEFKINRLQAKETNWLNQVILLKVKSNDFKMSYSLKSDNTDGSCVGELRLSNYMI